MERTNPSERRDNGLSGKAHLRFGSFAVVRGKTSAFSPHCDRKSRHRRISMSSITPKSENCMILVMALADPSQCCFQFCCFT